MGHSIINTQDLLCFIYKHVQYVKVSLSPQENEFTKYYGKWINCLSYLKNRLKSLNVIFIWWIYMWGHLQKKKYRQMQLSAQFQIFFRTGNSPWGSGMIVSNGTCFSFLCVFSTKPQGVGREKNISVNVTTAMQIKTVLSQRLLFRDVEHFCIQGLLQ